MNKGTMKFYNDQKGFGFIGDIYHPFLRPRLRWPDSLGEISRAVG